MNLPQVYMCSPSWTLLPPHSIPLGRPSAPAPSIQYHASNLDWQLVSYMIFYIFQCHSPKSSHVIYILHRFLVELGVQIWVLLLYPGHKQKRNLIQMFFKIERRKIPRITIVIVHYRSIVIDCTLLLNRPVVYNFCICSFAAKSCLTLWPAWTVAYLGSLL